MTVVRLDLRHLISGDRQANRVVPPSGVTAHLTIFAAAAMAFLAVFAMAMSLAAGRLAARWGDELAQSSTIRVVAPADQIAAQTQAALGILETTAGVAFARALDEAEQRALLAPWFGAELDLQALPVPQLIEMIEEDEGFDAAGLRLRLAAEVPGAFLDDHSRWRAPLVEAAGRLRLLGWISALLLGASVAAIVTLAARAALAANAQVISVLRLVGATDRYIAQAFIRRFSLRAFGGATIGVLCAMIAVAILPGASEAAGLLTGLSFQGWHWVLPLFIPPLCALVAFLATGVAARRTLGKLT
ncbi:cell division protein FtsX [Roseobacter cerasinus]|uniref:Cell division protein FtsX n=1 Tax=Roseobacter cerasinus TaxID=2602289 RepID=A0A640VPP3_9RHOB|nr:FtsX-like permease family protein [Roseobacter cerasinus]GFE48845.1 cell division protein FtsX [Roseobacter cerasinus]